MNDFVFEKAENKDLSQVAGLYRSVIGQQGCVWNENYPTMEDAERDYCAGSLYVLHMGSRVAGAVSVVPENELDDIDCWSVRDGTHREIARVAVAKEYQGHGYAREMLNKLLNTLAKQGCRSVHLLAATDNPPAVRLYRTLGFDFIGECDRFEHHYYICEKRLTTLC